MKTLPDNSVDAVVTDPPAGISFMQKSWDDDKGGRDHWVAWLAQVMSECRRVLKPGSHALVWGLPRTSHWTATAVENAGFDIRDIITHHFGSGFPKSTSILKSGVKQGLFCDCKPATKPSMRSLSEVDLSTPIDTKNKQSEVLLNGLSEQSAQMFRPEPKQEPLGGEESVLEGWSNLQTEQGKLYRAEICPVSKGISGDGQEGQLHNGASSNNGETSESNVESNGSCPPQGSQHAEQLHNEPRIIPEQSFAQACGSCGKARCDEGLGTALKPASEHWILARKPLEKGLTLAQNVLKWGTGGLNIDASRIGTETITTQGYRNGDNGSWSKQGMFSDEAKYKPTKHQGRWPANLLLDETAAEMLDLQSGIMKQGGAQRGSKIKSKGGGYNSDIGKVEKHVNIETDTYGASRFFYVAKTSKAERNRGLEGMPETSKVDGFTNGTNQINSKWVIDARHPNGGYESAKSTHSQNSHPTVKPIKLMEYLITLITPPNGTVLDPFMGSGSTGIAAKNLKRNFIGCEMNEEYFAIAKKRIEANDGR